MAGELVKTGGEVRAINAGGAFDQWAATVHIKNASTLKAYIKAVKAFALATGKPNPRDITAGDVWAWVEAITAQKAPATVRLYLAGVRNFFKWAVIQGFCETNVAREVTSGVKIDHTFKKSYLTAGQAAAVIGAITGDGLAARRDRAMVALMVTAGLRTVEVSRANVADCKPLGNKVVLYVQGKGRDEKSEFVEVAPEVDRLIHEYLAARGAKGDGPEPLFCSVSKRTFGQALAPHSVSYIAKKALRAAGFDDPMLTAHSFRHTAATLAVADGQPIDKVQELLRHKSIDTTRIYQHWIDRASNDCAAGVAELIFTGRQPRGQVPQGR